MQLGAEADQVAVVGFNREAWIAQRLTPSRASVEAALEGLGARMAEHTRLDLALKVGAEALGPATPGRERIMILLTDGLPNQVPYAEDGSMDTTILRAAAVAKASGATLYTVALGRTDGPNPEVNAALLRQVATRPDTAYVAPEAGALEGIYREIAIVIPCGQTPYWPAR
jgi:Mg-chelatase subunit ChlD